jgi:hypothetical protein
MMQDRARSVADAARSFVVMTAGAINGMCFAFMWAISMYQMWLSSPPLTVVQRMGGDIPGVRLRGADKSL